MDSLKSWSKDWRAKEQRWTKWYKGKIHNDSPRKLLKEGLLAKGTPPTKDATRTAMRKCWDQTALDAEPQEAEPPQAERTREPYSGYVPEIVFERPRDEVSCDRQAAFIRI